jgi:hypothetical protein
LAIPEWSERLEHATFTYCVSNNQAEEEEEGEIGVEGGATPIPATRGKGKFL